MNSLFQNDTSQSAHSTENQREVTKVLQDLALNHCLLKKLETDTYMQQLNQDKLENSSDAVETKQTKLNKAPNKFNFKFSHHDPKEISNNSVALEQYDSLQTKVNDLEKLLKTLEESVSSFYEWRQRLIRVLKLAKINSQKTPKSVEKKIKPTSETDLKCYEGPLVKRTPPVISKFENSSEYLRLERQQNAANLCIYKKSHVSLELNRKRMQNCLIEEVEYPI